LYMSDLDKCSLVSDFTLLKAAVRGQHYQDAEFKNIYIFIHHQMVPVATYTHTVKKQNN